MTCLDWTITEESMLSTRLPGEDDLLPRIAAGDPDAVRACASRYGGLVWNLARRFCPTTADAEDAVQEIMIALWQNAGRFDPSASSEPTFVTMIARRRLIDRLRRASRRPSTEPIDATSEPVSSGGLDRVETDDEAERARTALRQLPPDQQRVLSMAIDQGLSYSQIADKLNAPLGTIKTHARRGLIRLREMLFATGRSVRSEGLS
jgi:RNA polymerase sigma-70 factor (ECF subfamily)